MKTGSAEVTFDWGDDEHRFKLGWKQILELEEKTGLGCQALLEALAAGTAKHTAIRHIIWLGLVGPGMEPEVATGKVRKYVENRPLKDSLIPAFKILQAAWDWPEDPLPKKDEAEADSQSNLSGQTDASAEPPSLVFPDRSE